MTIPMALNALSEAPAAEGAVDAPRASATALLAAAPAGQVSSFVPGVSIERRKRGRPRDPEADGRILTAAAELLLAHGFDNMTVDDVASRAHVGKATVYRRWAKKEDLAVAAMRRLYDTEMPVPDTGSLRDDLLQWFTARLVFANSEAGAAYLLTGVAESARDPRIAALYRAANAQLKAASRQMFERGILRGEVRADAHIEAALELVSGILLLRVITGNPMPPVEEAAGLVDLVLRGVSA